MVLIHYRPSSFGFHYGKYKYFPPLSRCFEGGTSLVCPASTNTNPADEYEWTRKRAEQRSSQRSYKDELTVPPRAAMNLFLSIIEVLINGMIYLFDEFVQVLKEVVRSAHFSMRRL